MTLKSNARLAGITFISYIVFGLTSLYLSGKVTGNAEGTPAILARMAENDSLMRITILLTLLSALCAMVLAVALYALTSNIDKDLARMGMFCRIGEAVIIAAAPLITLSLISLATAETAANTSNSLGDLILRIEQLSGLVAAICFAAGSTFFTWLFVRGRSIPQWLAWLGLFASLVLVIVLPLMLAGYVKGLFTQLVWLPMMVFELVLAVWLITKGVVNRNEKN